MHEHALTRMPTHKQMQKHTDAGIYACMCVSTHSILQNVKRDLGKC